MVFIAKDQRKKKERLWESSCIMSLDLMICTIVYLHVSTQVPCEQSERGTNDELTHRKGQESTLHSALHFNF